MTPGEKADDFDSLDSALKSPSRHSLGLHLLCPMNRKGFRFGFPKTSTAHLNWSREDKDAWHRGMAEKNNGPIVQGFRYFIIAFGLSLECMRLRGVSTLQWALPQRGISEPDSRTMRESPRAMNAQ